MRLETPDALLSRLEEQLQGHADRKSSDPQANPVKLLAYDISKDVEERAISFRTIEELIKQLSDEGAIERAGRLAKRAGLGQSDKLTATLEAKAREGWDAYQSWAERAGLGIVLTAHPTFSLSRDIRATHSAPLRPRACQNPAAKNLPHSLTSQNAHRPCSKNMMMRSGL